ncbi:hypothetical protein KXV85_005610, partial [Aspergillus fumigatus]
QRLEDAGEFLGLGMAGGKFDEFDAARGNGGGHGRRAAQRAGGAIMQHFQTPQPVPRDLAGRACTETVVEDFKAPIAVIADAQQLRGKFVQREIALPRHAAEMAAPVKQVHLQARRIGPLHDEQLGRPDVADAGAG